MPNAPIINRNQVITRMGGWQEREYSQSEVGPEGFRNDCSGFAAWCWGLSKPGPDTVGLVTQGFMRLLGHPDQLLPGDAIACAGPGTSGNDGHIVMFEAWVNDDPNDNRYIGVEMAGGMGPDRRVIEYPYDGDGRVFKPYRGANVVETSDSGGEDGSAVSEPLSLASVVTDGTNGEQHSLEDLLLRVFKMLDGRLEGPVRLDTMFTDWSGRRQSSENCWLNTQATVGLMYQALKEMAEQVDRIAEQVKTTGEMVEELIKPRL